MSACRRCAGCRVHASAVSSLLLAGQACAEVERSAQRSEGSGGRRGSEGIGSPVLQVCLEGPASTLNDTVYSQPALFVGGLAAVRPSRPLPSALAPPAPTSFCPMGPGGHRKQRHSYHSQCRPHSPPPAAGPALLPARASNACRPVRPFPLSFTLLRSRRLRRSATTPLLSSTPCPAPPGSPSASTLPSYSPAQ